ncbi:hypothetical protein PsorP6_005394 [Peronosclerospora sorghi]|uniref:Uncharacterized protein n=1 Tax=Peronosclerospora sorghi TaxID=230839 RepID=A0ACC0W5Y5_9STRA|nr:hypothetical protein PsorP6_005394 [Peronosclerospora sorghi]
MANIQQQEIVKREVAFKQRQKQIQSGQEEHKKHPGLERKHEGVYCLVTSSSKLKKKDGDVEKKDRLCYKCWIFVVPSKGAIYI